MVTNEAGFYDSSRLTWEWLDRRVSSTRRSHVADGHNSKFPTIMRGIQGWIHPKAVR